MNNFKKAFSLYQLKVRDNDQIYKETERRERTFKPNSDWLQVLDDDEIPSFFYSSNYLLLTSSLNGLNLDFLDNDRVRSKFKVSLQIMLAAMNSGSGTPKTSSFLNDVFSSLTRMRVVNTTPVQPIWDSLANQSSIFTPDRYSTLDSTYKTYVKSYITSNNLTIETGDETTIDTNINTYIVQYRKVSDLTSLNNIQKVAGLFAVLSMMRSQTYAQSSVLSLIITFIKSGNCSEDFFRERIRRWLTSISLQDNPLQTVVDMNEISVAWNIIHIAIKAFKITPKGFSEELSKLCSKMDNITITPLLIRSEKRNMTAPTLICTAMSSYSDFPWEGMIIRFPDVQCEIENFRYYLKIINNDKYSGYKYQGAAQGFKILAYVSCQLLIKVGSDNDLERYRGIGSKDTKINNKKEIDDFINQYIIKRGSAEDRFDEIKKLSERNKNLFDKIGVRDAVVSFNSISDETNEQSTSKEISKFFIYSSDSSSDDDDDKDDGKGKPGPSRSHHHTSRKDQTRHSSPDKYHKRSKGDDQLSSRKRGRNYSDDDDDSFPNRDKKRPRSRKFKSGKSEKHSSRNFIELSPASEDESGSLTESESEFNKTPSPTPNNTDSKNKKASQNEDNINDKSIIPDNSQLPGENDFIMDEDTSALIPIVPGPEEGTIIILEEGGPSRLEVKINPRISTQVIRKTEMDEVVQNAYLTRESACVLMRENFPTKGKLIIMGIGIENNFLLHTMPKLINVSDKSYLSKLIQDLKDAKKTHEQEALLAEISSPAHKAYLGYLCPYPLTAYDVKSSK